MKILLPALALAMAACASPSRARYAQLLGECREQNREHVRMLKEYQVRDEARKPTFKKLPDGSIETYDGCNTTTCKGAMCVSTALYCAPEQAHGAAEFGMGGW